LYGIYFVMCLVQFVLLCAGGMPVFDSIVTTFSTAGTGGFAVLNNSIEGYNNLYFEMVIAVFMLLFGVNFNLYYLLAAKQFKQAFKSEELRTYLGIIFGSTLIITLSLIISGKHEIGNSFRYAFFQVVTIITTTGFTSTNFDHWPVITKLIICFLTVVGACAGSTGGGIKVSRLMILFKGGIRDLRKAINPRSVETVKIDKKTVEEPVVRSVSMYFGTFMIITAVSTLIVALDGRDIVTTFTAVLTCMGNVGPGLGAVGPAGNFADFSILSKLILCFDMLAGRLELLPMIMIFSPYAWSRKY
ncbi:MAG: TrkH family potassium uptake protein, partial [Clostridia bacterium]|nr:TrkH family potassium uptake protein [Clostridia bacterium]